MLRIALIYLLCCPLVAYGQELGETHLTGVFKGKTLFMQNAYNAKVDSFCISSVLINGRPLQVNYRMSAIKLDFEGMDEYTPLSIRILHAANCAPVVINPDAIAFHSIFSFEEAAFNDSVLVWRTRGEKEGGIYYLERYQLGIWVDSDTIPSKGEFGGAAYTHYPYLEEGPNKLRIKYVFPDGQHLYSREIDFHFYPEPVTFQPFATDGTLYLSRTATYQIYDAGGTQVMSGQGNTIDVKGLPSGDYVVYFDNKDPGMFRRK